MINTQLIILSALLIFLLSGCSDSTPQTSSTDGKKLYTLYCETCHKSTGNGNFLKGIPANKLTLMHKSQLVLLIRQGNPSLPKMPTFPNLTEQQASAIVDYLFRL